MAVPNDLRVDLEEFRTLTGLDVDVSPNGNHIYIVISTVVLPDHAYRIATSDVLFIADQQYRTSALDMFYTEPGVVLADGSIPAGAEHVEQHIGRSWRRFSWHRNGVWNPARNGLLDHYEFTLARFAVDVAA